MHIFSRNILTFFLLIMGMLPVHGSMCPYHIYFYHGDHLGSANWITDANGDAIQYIHYAPYGELIANQMPLTYDERYKFTGKERDTETGYDFFGARFLWSAIGHWLSVDPLADKYPNISPYAYAAWNPVKFVDPDGNSPRDKIVGWTIGVITNVLPLTSLSNLRDSYVPDNSMDYNESLQSADNLAFCAGAFLMASGAADVVGGATLAETGLAVAATGVGTPEGIGVVAAGSALTGTGILKGAIGSILMANSTNNAANGYNKSEAKAKSINQLQQDVKKGKAPKGITDFHTGKIPGEQDHVHFKDGSALNKDGTWKHGKGNLTNDQKQYLEQNGWNIEQ